MSAARTELVGDILSELHGPVVQAVMLVLQEKGRTTAEELVRVCRTHPLCLGPLAPTLAAKASDVGIPKLHKVVSDCLITGVQYGFVLDEEEEEEKGGEGKWRTFYSLLPLQILRRLRHPKLLSLVRSMHNEVGEAVMGAVLEAGRARRRDIIAQADQAVTALMALPEYSHLATLYFNSPDIVAKTFRSLVAVELLVAGPVYHQQMLPQLYPAHDLDEDDALGASASASAYAKKRAAAKKSEAVGAKKAGGPAPRASAKRTPAHTAGELALFAADPPTDSDGPAAATTTTSTTASAEAKSRKRKKPGDADDDADEAPAPKRAKKASAKTSGRDKSASATADAHADHGDAAGVDDDTVFYVNYTKVMAFIRKARCVELVADKIDHTAGHVISHLFALLEPSLRLRSSDAQQLDQIATIALADDHIWQTYNAKANREPKDATDDEVDESPSDLPPMNQQHLTSYLSLMSKDSAKILTHTKSPPSTRLINMRAMIEMIKAKHVESIIHDKFGADSLRIFRLLKLKKMLEQKQISDLAMITMKQARDSLYRMLARNVVRLQEVPRSSDYSPAKTFYLWTVAETEIVQTFLEEIYQVILKLRLRARQVQSDGDSLFQRAEEETRLNAVILSDPERQQLSQYHQYLDQLEASISKLDETLMILSEF